MASDEWVLVPKFVIVPLWRVFQFVFSAEVNGESCFQPEMNFDDFDP